MDDFRFAHVWGVGVKSANRGWGLWDTTLYKTRREAYDAMRAFKASVAISPGSVRVFKYVPIA